MQTVPYAHQELRVLDIAYGLIEHSGEHYGFGGIGPPSIAAEEIKLMPNRVPRLLKPHDRLAD